VGGWGGGWGGVVALFFSIPTANRFCRLLCTCTPTLLSSFPDRPVPSSTPWAPARSRPRPRTTPSTVAATTPRGSFTVRLFLSGMSALSPPPHRHRKSIPAAFAGRPASFPRSSPRWGAQRWGAPPLRAFDWSALRQSPSPIFICCRGRPSRRF
jgi:hypothetical protein